MGDSGVDCPAVTLAEVLQLATDEWESPSNPADIPADAQLGEYLAAAVRAHLLSEAVVERAAKAAKRWPEPCEVPDCFQCELMRDAATRDTRSAISAAVGDGGERDEHS